MLQVGEPRGGGEPGAGGKAGAALVGYKAQHSLRPRLTREGPSSRMSTSNAESPVRTPWAALGLLLTHEHGAHL